MHVRRYAEALPLLEQAAGLTPTGAPRLILRRARVLLELGRKAEAETVLRQYLDGFTAETDRQMANEAIWCLRALGWQAEAERRATDQLRQNPGSYSSGAILVMLGQLDRAYPLLEKTPPIFMQQIYWDPLFDPLRDTPRFQQLLVKLDCVEEYKVARATQARLLQEQGMKK
jgi:tetratricopeptide (TPR) repeat protein